MSKQLSRALLLAETILLMVPASLLVSLVFILSLPQFRYSFVRAPIILLAASVLSVACLWRIVFCFYSGGAVGLRALSLAWWSGAVLGALIAVAALTSNLASPSPPYSALAEFRRRFNLLAFGLPLLAPLLHLGCETLFRRSSNEITAPNGGPAAVPGNSAVAEGPPSVS